MTDIPEKDEARLRAKYLHLFAESQQAAIADDASPQETPAEPIGALLKQANIRTGARDLLVLAVSSFLVFVAMIAGKAYTEDDKAGAKRPVDKD